MIELYDHQGRKVAEIRDTRLVSMDGDCLARVDWDAEEQRARLHADMARQDARFEDGWLVDDDGRVLACADPQGGGPWRWREESLTDWAYGRALRPEPQPD